MHLRRPAATATAVLLIVAGCTRPDDTSGGGGTIPPVGSSSTVAPSTAPVTTSVATTTPPTSSPTTSAPVTSTPGTSVPGDAAPTTAPTTSAAPATTAPPADPDDLTLSFDAVGPHRFGARDVDVVPALVALLGAPTRDDAAHYPIADDGRFLDEFEEESYIAPFGRTVCFSNALCIQFGAGAPETRILSGWRIDDSATSDLRTVAGIGIGSSWADHRDTIDVEPLNSCYQIAYAESGGIDVTLSSAGAPFAAPNEEGAFVPGDPDPADVTVIEMSAGELPVFVFADC